jgi:ElaB/YqjD/DUF883 family membrane-anchored ribosome-binding protein
MNRTMNNTQESPTDSSNETRLAEDAQALLAATVDVAGEKVAEARKRLTTALEAGKVIAARVRDRAVAGAKVADATVRENPYTSLCIAFGAGALIGYLMSRRGSSNRD